MFKVNIASVKNEHDRSLDIRLSGVPEQQFGDDAELVSSAVVQGKLINVSGEIIFQGSISADLQLTCARCLKKYSWRLEKDVIESFGHASGYSKRNSADEEELWTDEQIISGEEIDFQPLVVETIVLNLPLKNLCSPDCQGLCPKCGHDLNQGRCGCVFDDIDPRLEALKNFKI